MAVRMAVPASRRQPVPVDAELYEKFRSYSKLTGIPVAALIRRALQAHYDDVLATKLESMAANCPGGAVKLQPQEVPNTPIEASAVFTAADAMSDATVLEGGPAPVPLPDVAPAAIPEWAQD